MEKAQKTLVEMEEKVLLAEKKAKAGAKERDNKHNVAKSKLKRAKCVHIYI